MPFRFKRRESVASGVRRLGRKQSQAALESLQKADKSLAVHGARKRIKKNRALLRLIRPDLGKKTYRRQATLLRAAAGRLSPVRDAFVLSEALKELRRHFRGKLTPEAMRILSGEFRDEMESEWRRFKRKKVNRSVQRLLKESARAWDEVRLNKNGWKAICDGLESTFLKAQYAHQIALSDPTPENFHQWRKRTKDLSYDVRLLRPIWPEQLEAMSHELETLGQCLGDDHDLVMLRKAAARHEDAATRGEIELLQGLVEQRHRELRASALALGARFFSEKPSVFRHRLATYWHTWRHEKSKARRREPAHGKSGM